MTKPKMLFLLILISLGSLTAQTFIPQITSENNNTSINNKAANSLNILAVMVEFQTDKYNLTTGDGTFGSLYTKDYGTDIIDPLPHNANYFKDHLEFAKNYFSKVSKGNLDIQYTVLPNIVTVSKVMREYSPVDNNGNLGLGEFAKEVWQKNVNTNPNIDYTIYDLFVIFHAGAGKDISTSELLGESRDLPSLYLGLKSFKNFYGESFTGIELSNGQNITNTILLPETESRESDGIGGLSLIELSINGLIVSSIASHLGLPDLFDSETGKSAIGRFGLMDGESLFAYKGLFPPEPSAWEKVFLGWDVPLVINSSTVNIEVIANEIAQNTDVKIVKVPINSSEYYLIENRARDANNDGIKITYKIAGQVKTLSLPKDTTKFNNFNTDTLSGVVLNVDEFDWAVPGSGILIWHIDEKIISQTLSDNRVNADKNRRGVDLEEADGIQDIGEEFKTIFGDVIIAQGDKHDLWFANNKSEFYTNKFNGSTKPNTNSNDGAKSLISFSNFSNISNRMTFDVNFGSENIKLIKVKSFVDSIEEIKLLSSNSNIGYFLSHKNLYIIDSTFSDKRIFENFSVSDFTLLEKDGNQFVFGAFQDKLNISSIENSEVKTYTVDMESIISAPIICVQNNDRIKIYIGMQNGKIAIYNFDFLSAPVLSNTFDVSSTPLVQIAVKNENVFALHKNGYSDVQNGNILLPTEPQKMILANDKNGKLFSIVLTNENYFYIIQDGKIKNKFKFLSDSFIRNFSLGDIKQDGENYILFYTDDELNAINVIGNMADNYPIKNGNAYKFISYAPLIADINNDGFSDVVCTSHEGVIFTYSGMDGQILNDFPISTGNKFFGYQSISKRKDDLLLATITEKNDIYFWSIKSNGRVDWGSKFGNNQNNSFLGAASGSQSVSEFFPKNRTYNWPNPVYENFTNIRTYVSEDSKIIIRIFDLSGDLVDILEYDATGGLDNEITWDVSNIQSGAYFAQVEVKSNSGKTESKIIKIAVVK